jgi:hypothetical protein
MSAFAEVGRCPGDPVARVKSRIALTVFVTTAFALAGLAIPVATPAAARRARH